MSECNQKLDITIPDDIEITYSNKELYLRMDYMDACRLLALAKKAVEILKPKKGKK